MATEVSVRRDVKASGRVRLLASAKCPKCGAPAEYQKEVGRDWNVEIAEKELERELRAFVDAGHGCEPQGP
jgi:Zn ribbon nucleic-acid-binding protein